MSSDDNWLDEPDSDDEFDEPDQIFQNWPAIHKAAKRVSRDNNYDVYLYSGPILDDSFEQFASVFSDRPREKALLILVTDGGSANTAFQMARLLQRSYDQFHLYAPSFCKSAGTIIALGANRLILDDFSELGPLDVQLDRQDELWDTRSGLVSRSAFRSLTEASFDMYQQIMMQIKLASSDQISFRLASDTALKMVGKLMKPVYEQLNPELIGSDFRDLEIAQEYGARLAKRSGNAESESVRKLVNAYPSHDFVIDIDEAKTLFRHVDPPSENMQALVEALGDKAQEESRDPLVLFLESSKEPTKSAKPRTTTTRRRGSKRPQISNDEQGDESRHAERKRKSRDEKQSRMRRARNRRGKSD